MIKIKARAKLNLSLNVEGMYDKVYHRLSSVVTTVDVFDMVTVAKCNDKGIIVSIDGSLNSDCLVCKVAQDICDKYDVGGIRVDIERHIPFMAGMGGSSVDSAAVIYAMSILYNLPMNGLLGIASKHGSDITYLLKGGLALISGKGDDVVYINDCPQLDFVVINGAKLITADVFAQYDRQGDYTRLDNILLIQALCENNIDSARVLLGNNLQSSAIKLAPKLGQILITCEQLGITTPIMTGSGGNMFVLCKDSQEAVQYCALLTSANIDCYITHSTPNSMDIISQ